MNPRAGGLRRGGPRGRRRRRRPAAPGRRPGGRSTRPSSTNPTLRVGADRHLGARPARRAVLDELLDGKVVAPAPAGLPASPPAPCRPPRCPSAIDWLAHRAAPVGRGRARRPSRSSATWPPGDRVGGYATAVFEELADRPASKRSRTSSSGSPAPSRRTPALRSVPWPTGTCRSRCAGAWSTSCWRARSSRPPCAWSTTCWPAAAPATSSGTLDWLVEQTAEARGWRVARVELGPRSTTTSATQLSELAGPPDRLAGRAAGDDRPRRCWPGSVVRIGDLQVDATRPGPARRTPRAHGVGLAGRSSGTRQPITTTNVAATQREHSDGRADDRRQRDHRGASPPRRRVHPVGRAPSRSGASSRSATASPGSPGCRGRR